MRTIFLFLAWLLAVIGMVISLYFGEVLGLKPCPLCWYQRIALYPLAIFLGMALYKKDENFIPYGITLASLGLLVAIYHVLVQIFPFLDLETICGRGNDCSAPIFNLFGFLTLPILSAIGFFLIVIFLSLTKRKVIT